MNKNKYIGIVMMAGALVTATSCSDFDDYNKSGADATPAAGQTLWENIQQNPQLSQFKTLLEKSGFANELNQAKFYTVWAPLDGTFDPSPFQGMDNAALMKQFVQNHIASYAHRASGSISERVLMLNEKSYTFEGSSAYTFDDVTLTQTNLPSSNGLLHTLGGVATFYPNLYEFVTDEGRAADKGIDSLRQFFLSYENTYLDTERSVPGSIVNGMQTYVDSVMVTENTLWQSLNAKIHNEDSTYTFLMPTNRAWRSTYDMLKSCFNYLPSTPAQAFSGTAVVSSNPPKVIDNVYMQDSLVRRYLTRNLIYSNNDVFNQWLVRQPSTKGTDTLRTTTRRKLSNPADILAQTVETVKMSNGKALIVDSLAFLPWETYAPAEYFFPYSNRVLGRVANGSARTISVQLIAPGEDLSNLGNNGAFSYLLVEPTSGYAKPEINIFLPDVLSTTYEFYCVFSPVYDKSGEVVTLPNRVIFTLNYSDETGKLKDYVFKDTSEKNQKWFDEYYAACQQSVLATDPKATFSKPDANTLASFSNDVSRVDTVFIGEFTFPVSYYGLGDGYCPNIKITSPFSVFNKALLAGFSRDLRIASIILKPKELAEFEESNKQ